MGLLNWVSGKGKRVVNRASIYNAEQDSLAKRNK